MNLSSSVLIDLVILIFMFDNRTGNAQHLEIVDSSPNHLLQVGSEEIGSSPCKCFPLLSLTFVEIKKSFA